MFKYFTTLISILSVISCNSTISVAPKTNTAISYLNPLAEQIKLKCAEISAATDSLDASQKIDLSDESSEGGWAEAFKNKNGSIIRIKGGLLGESSRFDFDYYFENKEMLCAYEINTNQNTISQSSDIKERPELYWTFRFSVFSGGEMISEIQDRAPAGYDLREPAEIIIWAESLLNKTSI